MSFIEIRPEGVVLRIKVQPRASKTEIGELLGEELKVKVTVPPVDSAANEAVEKLLAKALGCPRGAVKILRGRTSTHKQVLITGVAPEMVAGCLIGK